METATATPDAGSGRGVLAQDYQQGFAFNGIGNIDTATESANQSAESQTAGRVATTQSTSYRYISPAAGQMTDQASTIATETWQSGRPVAAEAGGDTSYAYDFQNHLTGVARTAGPQERHSTRTCRLPRGGRLRYRKTSVPSAMVLALLLSFGRSTLAGEKSQPAQARTYENKWFSLALPDGWERGDPGKCARKFLGAPKATVCELFTTDGGEFLMVVVDPPATELPWLDARWRLEATGDGRGIVVADTQAPCTQTERAECLRAATDETDEAACCTAGDGRLDIVAMGPAIIPAHDLMFWFGSGAREDGVPLGPFARMLSSFRSRAR